MGKKTAKTFFGLAIFSLAMGYLEAAVVIYLRMLYYPAGFHFPLAPIPPHIALVEFFREMATLVMLAGIAILVGRSRHQRFAFFLFCFGIWDIFYYVFLKVLIGWPVSWFTLDILFLIPVPWIGPVIAPCIASLTMIGYAIVFSRGPSSGFLQPRYNRSILGTGSLIMIISFLWDYVGYWIAVRKPGPIWTPGRSAPLFGDLTGYSPSGFNWMAFWLGEALVLWAIFRLLKVARKSM